MSEPPVPRIVPIESPAAAETAPHLQRVLSLGDLVLYGIVLIQPVGVIGMFGVASQMSRGHMLVAVLLAMVAMMLTAVSYGRMAALYPSAGSAYTYVGQGLNPHLGFLAGWAMVLDYLIVPVVNVIYGALSLQRLLPGVPYWVWVLIIGLGMTVLNARGIRWTARANQLLLAAMCAVIGAICRCGMQIHGPHAGLGQPVLAGAFLQSRDVRLPRRMHGHVVRRSDRISGSMALPRWPRMRINPSAPCRWRPYWCA